MDWLIFILSVIEAIAWPVGFVAAVVFLRQEWVDVIGRIQGIKHKETQIEFGNRLQQTLGKRHACRNDCSRCGSCSASMEAVCALLRLLQSCWGSLNTRVCRCRLKLWVEKGADDSGS